MCYIINRNGERTWEIEGQDAVMSRLGEMLKYHYIYKSPQAIRVRRTHDYVTEKITFYMRNGCKYIFEMPLFG